MTKIYLGRSGSVRQLVIKGHSGYAKKGADIVCAGISALSQSFIKLAAELDKRNVAEISKLEIRDGELMITVNDKIDLLAYPYIMLTMGLEEIANQYPDNVILTGGEIKKTNDLL